MCLLQSTVYDQMEETSSKGLTEATLKEHRMQRISAHICVLGKGYVEAICLCAEKKLPHSFTHPLYAFFFSFFFFLWLRLLAQFRKCGDAQLVGGVSLFNSLFEQASFRLSPPPSPHSPLKTPGQTWPVK